MPEPQVWTFFYGSYMSFDVLREANVARFFGLRE